MSESELRALRDGIDKTLSAASGELSDEQLDVVSGGADRIHAQFRVGSSEFRISSDGKSYTVCRYDDSAPGNGNCTTKIAK
jgi:hypothetical protein